MANIPAKQFYGAAQTCINTTSNIADGNFSGAPAATYDNTSDSTYPHAPYAKAVLQMPDWAAAPTADSVVELWGVKKDVDGTTDDTDAPSGTARNGAQWMGAFPVAAVDALQIRTITLNMIGIEKMDFYLRNRAGQQMTNNGGTACTLKVTPLVIGAVTP